MIRWFSSFINRFYSFDSENMSDDEYYYRLVKVSAVGSAIYAIITVAILTVMVPPKGILSTLVTLAILWSLSFFLLTMIAILGASSRKLFREAKEQGEKHARSLVEHLESLGLTVKKDGSRVIIIGPTERTTVSFIPFSPSYAPEGIDQGEEK